MNLFDQIFKDWDLRELIGWTEETIAELLESIKRGDCETFIIKSTGFELAADELARRDPQACEAWKAASLGASPRPFFLESKYV